MQTLKMICGIPEEAKATTESKSTKTSGNSPQNASKSEAMVLTSFEPDSPRTDGSTTVYDDPIPTQQHQQSYLQPSMYANAQYAAQFEQQQPQHPTPQQDYHHHPASSPFVDYRSMQPSPMSHPLRGDAYDATPARPVIGGAAAAKVTPLVSPALFQPAAPQRVSPPHVHPDMQAKADSRVFTEQWAQPPAKPSWRANQEQALRKPKPVGRELDSAKRKSQQDRPHCIFKDTVSIDGVEVLLRVYERLKPWRLDFLAFDPITEREYTTSAMFNKLDEYFSIFAPEFLQPNARVELVRACDMVFHLLVCVLV